MIAHDVGSSRRGTILLSSLALVAACEGGGKTTVQVGYRGLGQEINYDISSLEKRFEANALPAVVPPQAPGPPAAWQNVQVLNDISVGEFNRTMIAMTNWVSPRTGPTAGCAYCHVLTNFATDTYPDGRSIYAKVVARRMLQMNRHINSEWKTAHVGYTGVTCYTCHRGQPVPNGIWFYTDENQYLRHYLDRDDIRVQSTTVHPTNANRSSIKQTENTYGLMLSISRALGVNCAYCHNSRQWAAWEESSPQRSTAIYGMRMARDLNTNYLQPLAPLYPSHRLGPLGDAPKVSCVTCHQGVSKPLYGASMVKDYPALWGQPTWDSLQVVRQDTTNRGLRPLGRDSITGGR